MRLIRLSEDEYKEFTDWLGCQAYPSASNYPYARAAWQRIFDAKPGIEVNGHHPNYAMMLREFHEKYGHHVSDKPTIGIPWSVIHLRIRLMYEELGETISAMVGAQNIVEIADGLADLLYVVFGTAVSYGIPIDKIFAEVHRSNMTKSTEVDDYGKTIKGPEWTPPNLLEIIDAEY